MQASYQGRKNVENEENDYCDSDSDQSLDRDSTSSAIRCAPRKRSVLELHLEGGKEFIERNKKGLKCTQCNSPPCDLC